MGVMPVAELVTRLRQAGRESRQLLVLATAVGERINDIAKEDITLDPIRVLLDRFDLSVDEIELINNEIVGHLDRITEVMEKSMRNTKW